MRKKSLMIIGVAMLILVALGANWVRRYGRAGTPCAQKQESQKLSCWREEIRQAVRTQSVGSAFALLKTRYREDRDFQSVCHDMTHVIGAEAFRKHGTAVDVQGPDSETCAYGFYHGYLEAILGSGGNIEDAVALCERTGGGFQMPCYHGIGHAAFDLLGTDTRGDALRMASDALSTCRRLTDEPFKLRMCGNGVFNSLHTALGRGAYGVHLTADDPFRICEAFVRDEEKRPCYGELALFVFSSQFGSDLQAFPEVLSLISDPAGEEEAVLYLAADAARNRRAGGVEKPLTVCIDVPARLHSRCVEGAVQGVLMVGEPGNTVADGLALCQSTGLAEDDRVLCFGRLFDYAGNVYSRARAGELCRVIPAAYHGTHCEN